MKNRIIKIERNLAPNSTATNKGATVAITHADGKIYANNQFFTNEATFRHYCEKHGINTVLFLPANGRDENS